MKMHQIAKHERVCRNFVVQFRRGWKRKLRRKLRAIHPGFAFMIDLNTGRFVR